MAGGLQKVALPRQVPRDHVQSRSAGPAQEGQEAGAAARASFGGRNSPELDVPSAAMGTPMAAPRTPLFGQGGLPSRPAPLSDRQVWGGGGVSQTCGLAT